MDGRSVISANARSLLCCTRVMRIRLGCGCD